MDFRVQKHEGQVTTAAAIRLRVFISFSFFLSSLLGRTETCVGSHCEGPRGPHILHLWANRFICFDVFLS